MWLTRISGTEAATLSVYHFYYDAHYKIVICKKHKKAVKGLDRHRKDAHGLRKRKERQPLLDHYAQFPLARPEDVATPPTNSPC